MNTSLASLYSLLTCVIEKYILIYHQIYVTDEYILVFSVPSNIMTYIHYRYIIFLCCFIN
jgi:hypothetical protein